MKFVHEYKGERIEFQVHEHATLDETLDAFRRFLLAAGYSIPLHAQLEVVEP